MKIRHRNTKEEKVCEVCGRVYYTRNKPNKSSGLRMRSVRPYGGKTCSKKCSRVLVRIKHNI